MRNKKQLSIIIPPVEKQYVTVTVIDKSKYSLYNVKSLSILKDMKDLKSYQDEHLKKSERL